MPKPALPSQNQSIFSSFEWSWDTTIAVAALIVSVYTLWNGNKQRDFDAEYGEPVRQGCDEVRTFLSEISATVNIQTLTERRRRSSELLGEWNNRIHPLQNALKYIDDNVIKDGQGSCSQLALSIYDDVGEMLEILDGNGGGNWKATFDAKERGVNVTLGKIHSRIKVLRRKKCNTFYFV